MVELVSKCIASTLGVGRCGSGDPRVAFVGVLVVAVVIGVADVESVLGAIEFDLVPLLALCVFYNAFLVRIGTS